MTMIEVEPQPRIDTVVRLPGGGEARRTEYVGTVWFDGKPQVSGLMLRRAPNAPRGIRTPNFSTSFFVPDSLAYHRAALGDATLSVSVVLQASGDDERDRRRRRDVHRRPVRYADVDPGAPSGPPGLAGRRGLPHRRSHAPRRGSVVDKPPRRLVGQT